jgi:hypothetical protein
MTDDKNRKKLPQAEIFSHGLAYTGLHSKIRPSLRPGTPGDQEDSDSEASCKDGGVLPVRRSRADSVSIL